VSVLERVALSEIATSVAYGVTASATEQPLGPKFLRITDIQNGSVDWDRVPWCECDDGTAAGGRLKQGDIVFARTGATTGKSFLIRDCPSNAVFASYLIRVRLGDRADSRYVSHYFRTPEYWAQITASARGVAQPGVNASTLKALKIPLPPIAEQRRIAEVLDRAEALRAKRRAALAQLDTLTQSIFLDLFGHPHHNPKCFSREPLGQVCERVTVGYVGPMAEEYVERGIPLLRSQNVRRGRIDLHDLKFVSPQFHAKLSKSAIRADDVVTVRTGQPGTTAVVPKSLGEANCADLIVMTCGPRLDPQYLSEALNIWLGDAESIQGQVGAIQIHFNIGRAKELQLPIPPFALQREFTRRIEAARKLKTTQKASLTDLDALFAVLQHRAFRGEL
jgi:type I restriction enzyme S subunit